MKRRMGLFLTMALLCAMIGCTNVPKDNAPSTVTTTAAPSQDMVTVYLLEEIRYYSGGNFTYSYDENYNLISTNSGHYFEDFDANGMPTKMRVVEPDGTEYISTLTYTADGKLKKFDNNEWPFCGNKYKYDEAGNLIAEEQYGNGRLTLVTAYEYDGQTLVASRCEMGDSGILLYDTKVENGRIVEEYYKDPTMTYRLTYDEHGNLISKISDDAPTFSKSYTYKAVQVDAARAPYLREQQRHFIWLS